MSESGHRSRSSHKRLRARRDIAWGSRTRDLMSATVARTADLAISGLGAIRRVLRRRMRMVRGEVEHLRAAERAIAKAFAGLRGDGEAKVEGRRMKKSAGRHLH